MDEKLKAYVTEKKPHIFILTPCYGSLCHTKYVSSLMNTMNLCQHYGVNITIEFCNNDSLVPRARNNLIARAMSSNEMTHIMFIDADIGWNSVDIFKLLLDEKMLVGGIYPKKQYQW